MENTKDDEDWVWIQGGENNIYMNFSITNDGQRLELNGVPIYPPEFHRQSYMAHRPLHVIQVPASASAVEVASGEARSATLEVTSSGLRVGNDRVITDDGDRIIPIMFRIRGLENQLIDVDEVSIDLLETADGELLILHSNNIAALDSAPLPPLSWTPPSAPPPGPSTDMGDMKECNMLPAPICRFKSTLKSKIQHMRHHRFGLGRPCGLHADGEVHLPTHIKTHFNFAGPDSGHSPHHGRPHHTRPFEEHHGPHGHHHFFGAFSRGLVAVLIPVMAGISVGLTVSLIGLLVGRLIGYLWIKFARGGQRGYVSLTQDEIDAGEGKMLVLEEDLEAPPVYEDAPAYEEAVTDQK